jgi:hypothetical protein
LEVSSGQKTDWTQYITPALFAGLGVVVLGLIGYGVADRSGRVLRLLADKEIARGLITFLIAITTVGIAVILALSTIVLKDSNENEKRFDRGKQVLTMLIGVLGTIVGFYFGAALDTNSAQQTPTATEQAQTLAIAPTTLPDGAANTPYPSTTLQTTGGTPPLKWSVTPALPADLTLDAATGTISGIPTAALPRTTFTFTVTDSATPSASSPAALTLQIK